MSETNMLLGLKFKILGSSQAAIYKKDGEGYEILLVPTQSEKNPGVTIKELVTQVNALVNGVDPNVKRLDEDDITKQIEGASSGSGEAEKKTVDFTKLKVILDMAYLYINAPKQGTKTLEYAFSLVIDAKEVIPQEITFINIEQLTISIWNTERAKIKNQMALFDPKVYIE